MNSKSKKTSKKSKKSKKTSKKTKGLKKAGAIIKTAKIVRENIDNVVHTFNKTKLYEYLDKLDDFLCKKELYSFYYFPDKKGFKNKLNKMNPKMLEEMMKKDINKYKNRSVADISICINHKRPNGLAMIHGVLVHISIIIFKINDNGDLKQEGENGISVRWQKDDFKVSKITFKLIEKLMRLVYLKKYNCSVETFGSKLTRIIEELKDKKISIESFLEPLEI